MHLKEENITGSKLTHMVHSEDLILFNTKSSKLLLNTFNDLFNSLKGSTEKKVRTTVKVDGSPSIICASDFNGQTFVATKGFFSKKPKYATTEAECDELFGHSEDLAYKMKSMLKWASAIEIPKNEIWQGDFLFSSKDIYSEEIFGEPYVAFHPNTIVYAVPLKDNLSKQILNADIGVCWHTKYKGEDFQHLNISFNTSVDDLQSVPSVFQIDANIDNIAGKVTLTENETIDIASRLINLGIDIDLLNNNPNYSLITEDNVFIGFLNIFKNYKIKKDGIQILTEKNFEELLQFIDSKLTEKINSYKKENYKEKALKAKEVFLNKIKNSYKNTLLQIWDIQKEIILLKEFFIEKLNSVSKLKSFVKYIDKGYIPCSGEGFAVSDIDGNVQKLVSRLEFSRNNFSQEIVKGWTSEKREKESLKEHKSYFRLFEDVMEDIQAVLDPVFDQVGVENKKEVEPMGNKENPKGARYVLMPSKNSIDKREVKANKTLNILKQKPDVFKEPSLTLGGSGYRTPIIKTSTDIENNKDAEITLIFKPKSGQGNADSRSTKADEIYWAKCMSWYNCKNFDKFPNEDTDFDEISLAEFNLPDLHPKESNRIGYTKGTKLLLDNKKYFDNEIYYFSREEFTFENGETINIKSPHMIIIDTSKKIMRGFNQKDDWNPSDLYACKKSFYKTFLTDWEKLEKESTGNFLNTSDGAMGFSKINQYLKEQLFNKNLIGISLKDTTNPRIEEQNFHEEFDINRKNNFEHCVLDKIKCPSLLLKSEALRKFKTDIKGTRLKNGMIMGVALDAYEPATNTFLNIYYRSFGDSNLYVDAGENGKTARLGKTPKFIFNNLLIDSTQDKPIKLTGEKSKREVIENILGNDDDLIEKIKIIEKGPIPIYYPEGSKEDNITVVNWMLFKKKYLMNEALASNFSKSATQMDKEIDPKIQQDILALYLWPKIIDFIYMLEVNANNMDYVLKTLIQGAAKTYKGCAPHLKLE